MIRITLAPVEHFRNQVSTMVREASSLHAVVLDVVGMHDVDFTGTRVLVTGAFGFIGTAVGRRLALSIARTRWKKRTARVLQPDPPAAATAESV